MFSKNFFSIFHTHLVLMFIYCTYKPSILKLAILLIFCSEGQKIVFLYFLKYSPNPNMFQTNIADVNEICTIYHIFIFYLLNSFWGSQCSLICGSCKVGIIFGRYKQKSNVASYHLLSC